MKNTKILQLLVIGVFVTVAAGCAGFAKTEANKHSDEVIRKTVLNGQGDFTLIFYRDGKEIARQLRQAQTIVFTSGAIPDGAVKEYYPTGELFLTLTYKNNSLDGLSKMYFKSGAVKAEKEFKNNMRDGMVREYYQNGQLRGEATFKDDKAQGVAKYYFENGTLGEESNFADSKRDGLSKVYRDSGALLYVYTYKNGKLISTAEYDPKGKIIKKKKDSPQPQSAIPGAGEDHNSF